MKAYVAMGIIGVLLLSAHLNGFDGVLTASGVGIIAGLGGFVTGMKIRKPPRS
jgi:hypothetical protein